MALVKPLVRQSLRLSPIVPAPRRVIRTSSPRPWKVGWAAITKARFYRRFRHHRNRSLTR